MRVHRIRMLTILAAIGCTAGALVAGSVTSPATNAAGPTATGALVSVGSPTGGFLRNMQNQPALAVDPVQPGILAATGYDMEDMQSCSKQASITGGACALPATAADGGSWNAGVGMTGVYFSFNSGHNWIEPTYQGLTTAGCDPTADSCKPEPGPIHTVPNYYENGLTAFGDSSVAFGPVLRDGKFSWANGSRLYLSDLATNLTITPIRPGSIDSISTMAVSHIDDPTPARVAVQSNWSAPVIVPKTEPAISEPGGDQVWADNASSSPFFGTVYMCYTDYHFPATGNVDPIYPTIAVSTDGGETWTTHQVAPPIDSASQGYRAGCAIRTDSHGEVYAVFEHWSGAFPSTQLAGSEDLVTSVDGGATWTPPTDIMSINDGCYFVEPIDGYCTADGPAGDPNVAAPSIDIANGAPTGADATNEIAMAWTDGRFGQNNIATLLSYSTDGAKTWSAPVQVSLPGDRALYSAVAIAPDGSSIYVAYNGFTTPFATTTSTPRLLHGVLLSAVIGPDGAPADWVTDYVGPSGDARGTAPGQYNSEEFLGFYISAVATRSYGAGAWTNVSQAADCPAMDAWREATFKADKVLTPAPWPLTACPANFGHSDIWSATTAP
jgi:hypothetical protein